MKAAVVSNYDKSKVVAAVRKHFSISSDPDIVFTYGGDGTILLAERLFPGTPLVPVQKSRICSHCSVYSVSDLATALEKIKKGRYRIKEEQKVETIFRGRKIIALNEIQVHISDPRAALRFSFSGGGRNYREIIGDGVVVSTPYGSTAYYRSIGYSQFKSGLRAGFNNIWPRLPPVSIEKCTVRISRGVPFLVADNFLLERMKEGDSVTIRKSRQKARFIVI